MKQKDFSLRRHDPHQVQRVFLSHKTQTPLKLTTKIQKKALIRHMPYWTLSNMFCLTTA